MKKNAGNLPWPGGKDWAQVANLLALGASTAMILLSTATTRRAYKLRQQKTSTLEENVHICQYMPTPFSMY